VCATASQPVEPLPPVPAQPAVGQQPAPAGRPRRESSTYVRQGTAGLRAAFAPGTGQRRVEVPARRTGADYTRFMQHLAAAYPAADKIVLVQDHLNTHPAAVFYQHLPAAEARALSARFEGHYTPKMPPGSIWSNANARLLPASACTSAPPPRTNSPPTSPNSMRPAPPSNGKSPSKKPVPNSTRTIRR